MRHPLHLLLLAALCAAPLPAAEAQAPAASAERGRALYMTVGCRHCHGSVGQGSNAGPRLAPGPLPAEAIAAVIRNAATRMPPYPEAVLGNRDVADIAEFLRTIPPAREADDIPALRALK